MPAASDEFCSEILQIRGRATLEDIELKIKGRLLNWPKSKPITPRLVAMMVEDCARAARPAADPGSMDPEEAFLDWVAENLPRPRTNEHWRVARMEYERWKEERS